MNTTEKIDFLFNLLRENKTLSTHEQIDVENAIDCGLIDANDIFDDFVNWCSNNESFSFDEIIDFKEHFSNLLTYKENSDLLKINLVD